MTEMTAEKRNSPKRNSLLPLLLLVGSLGTILVVAVAMAVGVIGGMGDVGMTGHGWTAMALGIVFTVGIGGGLMALVFYSARRGYDDAASSGEDTDRWPGHGP